jgi:ATP-dependent Clp protease ATP-binding subunit ClpA
VFERFTDQARRVVVQAQEEARRLNHDYIGTEHLLLGLIREEGGVAAGVLEELGIGLEAVRQQVEAIIGTGKREPRGHIPFTPRAKKVLEVSLRESISLGNDYIGAGHILLGLTREKDGVAGQVLANLGVGHDQLRALVIERTGATPREGREELEARYAREEPSISGFVSRVAAPWRTFGVLERIDARLGRIERRLGIKPTERPRGLRLLDERLTALRARLEAAIDEGDFERARELREQELRVRTERDMSEHDWEASEAPVGSVLEELAAARDKLAAAQAELSRLALLLREHGIDLGEPATEEEEPPGDATASEG